MLISDLLGELRLGEEAAENDGAALHAGFVQTPAYYGVVDDEVDVVAGRKGTGKSAIYWALQQEDLRPADVDVVGLNTIGSDQHFQMLVRAVTGETQDRMRIAWAAYFLATATHRLNAVLGGYRLSEVDAQRFKRLAAKFHRFGIPVARPSLADLPATLARWVASVRPTATFGVDPGTLMPTVGIEPGAGGAHSTVDLSEFRLGELRTEVEYFLSLIQRRLWIIVDNLDEIFDGEHRETEELAIRALLRAHLDLAHQSDRFRTKVFVREDVFELITAHYGFPGATRMRRQEIRWTKSDVGFLLCSRLKTCEAYCATYQPNFEQPARALEGKLLPQKVDGRPSLDWLVQQTRDREYINPRNVLSLLALAKRRERGRAEGHGPSRSVLSESSLAAAFTDLSRKRLEDTVMVEYEACKPAIEAMSHGQSTYLNHEQFAKATGTPTDEVEHVVADLRAAGLLLRGTGDTLRVAPLYLPALSIR
jgi:hypothetical protein